jgi:RNA polymerase sigma-70 factor, ECF subfamily
MGATLFGSELAAQSTYLYRFALLRLRDEDLAREAVQDTMLAALENHASFARRSSLKTWLTAILKFKIVDTIRRQAREPGPAAQRGGADGDMDEYACELAEAAYMQGSANTWAHPEQALEQKQFWGTLQRCLEELPSNARTVFWLREVLGHSTQEICEEMAITETNCWVILHRARIGLRERLGNAWNRGIG